METRPAKPSVARVLFMNERNMEEQWKRIKLFSAYSVSDHGRIRAEKSERILRLNPNQYGLVYVGLFRDGTQYHRSVPLLVAKAFLPKSNAAYDTPINKDGDRFNNHVDNLVWRPRWFARKYNQQFQHTYRNRIPFPIRDTATGEISENSFECARRYGLLESDVVMSILNHTYTWPTYQLFEVLPH